VGIVVKVPLYQLKVEFPFRCENTDNESALISFKSWDDFGRSLWSKSLHETELNLVVRYQWLPNNKLQLIVVQLKLGRVIYFDIQATQAEEPAIRRWLAEQYKQLVQQWKPITARG